MPLNEILDHHALCDQTKRLPDEKLNEPLTDANGKMLGALNTLVDLTFLKKNDLELQRRSQQLRAIIDNTPECVKLLSPEGNLLDMNSAGLSLIEADSIEQVLGRSIFDLIAPKHREKFKAMHDKVCSGSKETLRFEIVGLKGKHRWMETYSAPFEDPVTGQRLHHAITRDISERREKEAAGQLLAAIVESSEDAIASKNLQGIITSWNSGAQNLFGYTRDEAIGQPVTMLIPADRIDEEPIILQRIRRGERIEHYETIRQRKDGSRVDISLTVSPIKDENGTIVGASKIARDITKRKQAETELQKRTRVLEIVNRTGAMLAAELSTERLLQTVTDAARQVTGAKFGLFIAEPNGTASAPFTSVIFSGASREAFNAVTQQQLRAFFNPSLADGVMRSDDVSAEPAYDRLAVDQGEYRFRSYLSAPVISRSGTVLGRLFFGHPDRSVFNDESESVVTGIAGQAAVALDNAQLYEELQKELGDHKRDEAALRQRESEFRSLSESIPQIVWSARADGHLDYYNTRWYEFTGFTENYGDASWLPILHKEDVARTLEKWRHSVKTGEDYEIEYRFRDRETGGYRWFLGRAVPVRNDTGEIVKWLGTCTDIDDQKRAAERLEQAVAERTISLKKAIAQMEEFSYSVSHDLRAPLRAIDGYTRIITSDYRDRLDPEVNEFLGKISRNIIRMQRLINDVLTLTRVVSTDVKLERIDLRELLREILEQHPALQRPNARIEFGELTNVVAHDVLFSQAATNILNNAVKFVRPGVTPEVKVWTETTDGKVRIHFQDNGIGIRPEHQAKLFGIFQRLSHTTHYEGTGIGLAIVRKSVERMGGAVGMESNGVDGSRFWIELPEA